MSGRSAPPVRWGFLGAGFVATRALAPAVHAIDGALLQVVGARDPARAAALEPVRAVGSYDEVLTADDVDVVYVNLPNDAHLPWSAAALAAGKHVLCEKPLGRDAAEVGRLAAAAAAAGRILVEACWYQWHPRTRRARSLLAATAGPRRVRSWFTFPLADPATYRLDPARGGGALLDLGPYAVGAACWALGAPRVEVERASQHRGPTGVDLTTTAVLAGPGGRAEVTVSCERPESQGLVVATPGLTVELPDPAFTSWRQPAVLRVVDGGRERLESFPAVDAYAIMVAAVTARVRGAAAWTLPLAESAAVAATLDAVAAAAGPGAGGPR